MMKNARTIPPVCLMVALVKLLAGQLRMSREFVGYTTFSDDGQNFTIFRHIKKRKVAYSGDQITFVVRFKFARLSHQANKLASLIPMLLIAGHPGFVQKLYAVNKENGHWQGMYEWESVKHLEAYRQSFVFRMMNKRAIKETVHSSTLSNGHLLEQLQLQKNT